MDIFSKEMLFAGDSGWVRPNLTDNGMIGGDAFAVDSSSSYYYNAYRAVDSNTDTYLRLARNNSFIFYNPTPLKVTQLEALYTSSSYYGQVVQVQGSNNGSTWSSISFLRSGTTLETITLTNPYYYKFYRLAFERGSSSSTQIRLGDLQIIAEEQ